MDKRQQKTRRLIFDTFYKLVIEKPYNKITVQDIIDEANIGRSTFYDHFETKDYLLQQMCEDLFAHIFNPEKAEKNHTFNSNCSFSEKITHILFHLYDEKDVIKGILRSSAKEVFLGYLRKDLLSLTRKADVVIDSVPNEFISNFIVGSFISTIEWWVKDNFKTNATQLSDYYLQCLKKEITL